MAVQFWPDSVALPSPWAEAFFFNPFAWQLPFVLGIVCGRGGQRCKALIPQSLLAIFVAAIGLEMAFLIKVGWWMPPVEIALDKDTLAPLRLLHFYCVLIVGRTLLPGNMRFLASGLLRPIILCGQHSLVTYCTGGLLATTGTLLLTKYRSETAWTVAVNTSGWILCLLVAYAAESYRRRRQSVAEQSRSGKFPNIRVPLLVCMFVATASISGTVARAAVAEDSVADRRGTDQGFLRKTWVDESGLSHRYVVFVPHHRQPGVRPPVLMFLNGMGENGNDGLRQITNNFGVNLWENREHFPFIAVAPQCRTEGSWTAGSQDVQWALQILEATIREYDADADRVYLTGVSSGGSGVWAMASAYPNRFAAVAPMCGSGGADAQSLAGAGVPIWNFYNERDGREVVDFSRLIRTQLLESGSSPLFTEYPVGGHDCWNRAYRTTALYRWLLEQRCSGNREVLRFIFLAPERLLQDWVASENSTWTADGDVITGNSNGPGHGARLVSSQSASEFELHGDVWMAANLDCRIGLMADNPTASDYWISILLPALGSGEVTRLDGTIIASLEPAAQQTLRAEAWNDIRIRVQNNHLHVRLNGWPAIDVPLEADDASAGSHQYRCILESPADGAAIRWRYIRTRSSGHVASLPAVSAAVVFPPRFSEKKNSSDDGLKPGTGESRVGATGHIASRWSDDGLKPPSGQMVFRLSRRTRSASYGEIRSAETAASDDAKHAVRVAFNKDHIRLDGQAVPALRIGRSILPDTEVWEATNEFIDTLYGNQQLSDPGVRVSRDWSVFVDHNSETHSWINGNAVPCVVKFPSGTAGSLVIHDAGKYGSLPILWGLVEAMRLSLMPQSIMTKVQHESASLQSSVTIRGRPCTSIQFPMPQIASRIACAVQFDESQGNSIVGATFTGDAGVVLARYDIDYDCDASGCWWPKTIGVVQFNGFGDPYDSMQMVRQSHSADNDIADGMSPVTLSAGSCVLDRTTGEQYRIADDGSHRRMPLIDAVRVVFLDAKSDVNADSGNRLVTSIIKTILTLVTWPWILVVLPAATFCWQILRVSTAKKLQIAPLDHHDNGKIVR